MFIHERRKLEDILMGLCKSRGFKWMHLESFLLSVTASRSSHSGFTKMCLGEFFCFYPLKEKNASAFCQPGMLKQQYSDTEEETHRVMASVE